MANSQNLLARLLNTPDLPAIVPRLQPEVLHRVVQTCGLEDCSELVALATPAQLARVLDLDLWHARVPGTDERFDADRFGVWLAVLLDAGPDVAAEKLAGLDINLVAEGFAQHVAVSDQAAVAGYTTLDGEEIAARASTRTHGADIGGYVVETRRTSAWDAVLELLGFLAAERREYFHRLMRACVRLSNGPRELDPSHQLLTDAEQHLFDLAGDRVERRERQGYVTPAQAHAFLHGARDLRLDGDRPSSSPLARAYFQQFDAAAPDAEPVTPSHVEDLPVEAVLDVLRKAGVLAPPPRALIDAGAGHASRLSWIEAHVAASPASLEELAYLANVVVAGCAVQGRRFTEHEAGDLVVATCNLGLENWPSGWGHRDLVTAFQIGWGILHRDVCVYSASRLIDTLPHVECADRDTRLQLNLLRRTLIRSVAAGEPWRARDGLDAILALDAPSWAALLGLIDECPVLHAALGRSADTRRTISPTDFQFISQNADIAAVRDFMAELPLALAG